MEPAEQLEQLEHVARRYWEQGATMEVIAAEQSVSRSTISRLLDLARATGVVTVTVNGAHGRAQALGRELHARFGVRAVVTPGGSTETDAERLEKVAQETARLLDGAVASGSVVAVAWGTTVGAIGRHVCARSLQDVQVVQLNGAMNTLSSGVGYGTDVLGRFATAWGALVHHFPVPAFFDRPETREAMWREQSVRRVLRLQRLATVALFGVGAVAGGVPSRVWADGYLTAEDKRSLRATGVVGDVCTVFLRADGSSDGIPLNERTSGLAPAALTTIPRRVCAVAGRNKAAGLDAALRAGLVTDLVVDESTAAAVLARQRTTRARTRRGG